MRAGNGPRHFRRLGSSRRSARTDAREGPSGAAAWRGGPERGLAPGPHGGVHVDPGPAGVRAAPCQSPLLVDGGGPPREAGRRLRIPRCDAHDHRQEAHGVDGDGPAAGHSRAARGPCSPWSRSLRSRSRAARPRPRAGNAVGRISEAAVRDLEVGPPARSRRCRHAGGELGHEQRSGKLGGRTLHRARRPSRE